MFKNFNHKFVYNYPLIWNTKIIPFTLIALVLHLIFFSVGYQNAIVGSVQIHNYYNQDSNAITINLFAILISVLVFIIWCILYFRNNAFKAFYPKANRALFKEWLLIVFFCMLNFSYALSSIFAANVQTRNIMPREVALEHCKTISKASMFLQGGFVEGNWIDSTINGEYKRFYRDSFQFEGKKYALNSLMNKAIHSFPFFDSKQDSLRRVEVQQWMNNDDKQAVANVFQNYFSIVNQHQLKSNISPKIWMELVYDYPEFTKYSAIGKSERELRYEFEAVEAATAIDSVMEEQALPADTISTTIKEVDGESYYYSKYYVSQDVLVKYYNSIASAWENPLLDWDFIMVVLYLSFGFSLAIFSFRVTSVRNWLIALIALGVIQIIFGIATAFFSYSMTFPILYLVLFLTLVVHFTVVFFRKKGKKWSGIVLNQILWMLPAFTPMIYIIILDKVKDYSGYNNRYVYDKELKISVLVGDYPTIDWLENNGMLLIIINFGLIVLVLFWLSTVIKKWRGIPEE